MMRGIYITKYNAICNLGNCIEEIFSKALACDNTRFESDNNIIKNQSCYLGKINAILPEIDDSDYNLRCNRLLLYCYNLMKADIDAVIDKYGKNRVAIIVATTNSGVDEFEMTNEKIHSQLGNPAEFLQKFLGLNNYCASVSTACTSGIKAFATGKKLLENNICDAVIVAGVDPISKLPVFGFNSLEVLSSQKSIPLSKNRSGMNISEGVAIFVLEKDVEKGIKILGIGETSDAYHAATPDPQGIEAANAIKKALTDAKLTPDNINYINLHGTGTISNDIMEANAIWNVFKDSVYVSSTKPLTGHCLGAAASIETALCCAMIDEHNPEKQLLPHVFDGEYDNELPKIKLVEGEISNPDLKTCMCNAFGFGGTNAVMIVGV